MNRFLFLLCFLKVTISLAQLPAESDPHRGMYFDRFFKASQTTSHAVDQTFSILSVDTNCDGIFEKEDAYLNYVCENHITYIALYDLGSIIGNGRIAWNENTKQYEDLEKHLCRFMEKAKHEYGVTQIGAIGSSPGFFSDVEIFMNNYPVSPACTTCQADFDVLVSEYEFWGDCNNSLPGFISIMDAMYNLKNTYNSSHPDNPLSTDAYIAFLEYCSTPGMAETAQVIDGCKNCSPFPGCSNPHPRKIDRVLYSIMTGSPTGFLFNEINTFENIQTFDSTDFHPILYSESMDLGGTYDFIGPWLESDPLHTIFIAEDYFYYFWRTASNSSFGQPQMNDVQPGGVQWFAGSYMFNKLKHPQMVNVIETYCTIDSSLVTLNYLGPDESGTDYYFYITNDSGGSTVYPRDGGQFSGVSQSTVNNPGYRTINFADTLIFPKLFLPKGTYTTHLNLRYNHSSGCSYSCESKIIIDDKARLEILGENKFCNGSFTFLSTNKGASNYTWYRNGKIFAVNNSNILKVVDDGDYHCELSGGTCPSTTDTVHITVHPIPNFEINAACNGNGTVTLKTNLLPTNTTSTQLFGEGGLTYRWNTGAVTDQITVSASSAMLYRLSVSDPYSGCAAYKDMKIPNPLSTSYSASINVIQQPSSPCSNDGSISASLTPAPGLYDPVRYLWSNGSNAQTISGLAPGKYAVTIKTYNQACSIYDTITIGQPNVNAPVLNQIITPSSCINSNGGSIVLNPSGGFPPFTYEWKDIPNENGYNPYTRDQNNLYPGIYSLLVTDSNGCQYNYSFTVGKMDGPIQVSTGTVVQVTGCASNQNGSATVTISGGNAPYTQSWIDSNGQSFSNGSNLHAGSYRVIATDQNGCTGFSFVHVPSQTEPLRTEVLDSSRTKLICDSSNTGSLYICIHGGIMPYVVDTPWSIQENIISLENLSGGLYSYIISDSAGCIFSDTLKVDSALLQLTTIPFPTSCIGCSNGEIHLSYQGGWPPYTISWSPMGGQISGKIIQQLPAGIYSVCITDSNQCNFCSQAQILDDPLENHQLDLNSLIHIFPNPAEAKFNIRVDETLPNDKYDFTIKDIYGQTIQVMNNSNSESIIDVSGFSSGIYVLIIFKNNSLEKTIRFVVNH